MPCFVFCGFGWKWKNVRECNLLALCGGPVGLASVREHVDSGDPLMPAVCLCAAAHHRSGQPSPSPLARCVAVLSDLEMSVDDTLLLSLWLPSRGSAAQEPGLLPCLSFG